MHKKLLLASLLSLAGYSHAQLTPEVTSWILNQDSSLGYNNIPSNVQSVKYSAGSVYISATCIPGYDIGPWTGNPNTPANQNFVFKITRSPQKNTGTLTLTGLGHIGVWTNGVSIFNAKDAMSYNNQGVWNQNAIVVEGPSFDNCLGHPAPNGEYHHHLNPTCLYSDSNATAHSPIIGFAFDGFPIYGAYAYADTAGTGNIVRMQSSYRKRNISKRTTLPNGSAASSAGPDVSSTYPLGYYVEDFEYVPGLGNLDEHNGRFCVTPEYPKGQYCYFVTLDSALTAAFPYVLGLSYYGTVPAGNTGPGSGHNTISEPVTTYTGSAGIKEISGTIGFSLFPNPSNGIVTISFSAGLTNNCQLEISDYLGKRVFTNGILSGDAVKLDLSELPRGLYFVKLCVQEKFTTCFLILE